MSDEDDFIFDGQNPTETASSGPQATDDDDVGFPTDTPKTLAKPWMKFHRFNLVKTVDEVVAIVDAAIAHGRCALDLETGGLDSRIDYDAANVPKTKHQIVGFCISVRGVGYYIPVRHNFNPRMGEKDPNVRVDAVEREITRLCQAAQPVPEDPNMPVFLATKFSALPKLVIFFWNAKFDQEFLYPVTGIELWNNVSFADGMLAAYSLYSDDTIGLKEKAETNLAIFDPDVEVGGKPARYPYEMIEFKELFPKGEKDRRFYKLYPEDGSDVVLYGCSDAICTEILCEADGKWEHTREGLKYEYKHVVEPAVRNHQATYNLERQAVQAVRDMERRRIKIDKAEIVSLLTQAEKELEDCKKLIVGLAEKSGFADFNPGSPQQLSNFLFEKKGLDINPKPEKTANGFYKTDASTLEKLSEEPNAPPVLLWIVQYRQIEKIKGTYLHSMAHNCDEFDQLRLNFNQTGAATGRFTAPAGQPEEGYAGIPIQGIPARDDPKKPKVARALRKAFVAREGYTLVKVDYAGQELRIVANLSGEPKWINEFLTGTGDLHTLTAKAFFGEHITKADRAERDAGKIANFSLIYGGGMQAIMRATKCDKVEGARRKSNFDKSVPVFAEWVKNQHSIVKKQRGVYTAFKRFIAIPDANLKAGDTDTNGKVVLEQDAKRLQAACERKSTNFPIQGSGADIMKISMVLLLKEFIRRGWRKEGGDDSVRVLMTIHDELVFEIRHDRLAEAVPRIITIMESPSTVARWKVRLVVEPLLGLSWDAKYDWYEIMHGKKPVPAWLEGTLVPEAPHTPEPSKDDAPAKTAAPATESKSESVDSEPPKKPVTSKSGTVKVATFWIGREALVEKSVQILFEAVSGSVDPEKNVYLRLMTVENDVLVDIHDRFFVVPETLLMKLNSRLLGRVTHELKDEAV